MLNSEIMCSNSASGGAAKCSAARSVSLSVSSSKALGAVLHCPAALWQRALPEYSDSGSFFLPQHFGAAPAYFLVHMVQVPDADGAMHASGKELPALGGLKWPSGLYDRARLKRGLKRGLKTMASSDGHGRRLHEEAERGGSSRPAYTWKTSSSDVLRVACICGDLCVVRELLALTGKQAVDVHAGKERSFREACRGGHVELVRELLALTGKQAVNVHAGKEHGFREACGEGHVEVVRELLALTAGRAVNVHASNNGGFRMACAGGHVELVRELLALTGDRAVDVRADNDYGFWAACGYGHVGVIRELLALTGDRRVDVHADNERGFRMACRFGHVGVVRELLALTGDRAVDVHAGKERSFREACRGGHVEVVRELLALTGDQAVDVHAWDDGGFWEAWRRRHLDVVCELLSLTENPSVYLQIAFHRGGLLQGHTFESKAYSVCSRAKKVLQYAVPCGGAGHLYPIPEAANTLGQQPSTAVADFCTHLLAAYCGDAPDDALAVFSLVAGHFPPGLPLPNLLSAVRYRMWAYRGRSAPTSDPDRHSACMQAALDACTHDTFRRPALAHQVIQQVLMHALETMFWRVQGMLRRYCVLLAALPAAECAPLRHVLQRHTHACGTDSCQLQADAVRGGAGETPAPQECLVVQCASQLRGVVWHGVRVPGQSVRYQVDEGDLRQALVRQGRRGVLLHRVASMAARRGAAVGVCDAVPET